MLRLTLNQMRKSVGKLTAAGIAIMIGTGFVAATLLASDLITQSVFDSIAARFANADAVVQGNLAKSDLATLNQSALVTAAQGNFSTRLPVSTPERSIVQLVVPTSTDPALNPLTLERGIWPVESNQIALPLDVVDRLGVDVGGVIDVELWHTPLPDGTAPIQRLEVVGVVNDPFGAYARAGGAGVMERTALSAIIEASGRPVPISDASVLLAPGVNVAQFQAAMTDQLGIGAEITTPHARASQLAAEQTGGQDLFFLVFVMTFAAIALLVAGLVIANTFQVLVAQRAKTLALLRAVGSSKAQVGRSILCEALILGLVSSLAGVVLGAGLGQAALVIARNAEAGRFWPETITVTPAVILIPVAAGVLVTMLAALVPARLATRVAPLAALRPQDAPSIERGSAGRVRLVLSLLMVLLGFGLLGLAVFAGFVHRQADYGLLLGVIGGAISFVGVSLSAVFWLPRVASLVGRLVGLTGPTTRLAAANTLRNPRRTAATSTALLIGVTLVATMATGAASARSSLTTSLNQAFPIDVSVEGFMGRAAGEGVFITTGLPESFPRELVEQIRDTRGVAAVAEPQVTWLPFADRFWAERTGRDIVETYSDEALDPDTLLRTRVVIIDPTEAEQVLNETSPVAAMQPGVAVIGADQAVSLSISDGDAVTFTTPSGPVTLRAQVVPGSALNAILVTPTDIPVIDPAALTPTLWVRLSPGRLGAVGIIEDLVADSEVQAFIQGPAVNRAQFESVINTALGVVVGLLAVAVVIALVGVANTLSLSVIERRRESATLRAIGVTRGQLRSMLAIEGVLIAAIGAVLGVALGLVYGWVGSLAGLSVMGDVHLAVPAREIAVVILIAIIAGLVASVAPGRSAVRPSPVAALAAD